MNSFPGKKNIETSEQNCFLFVPGEKTFVLVSMATTVEKKCCYFWSFHALIEAKRNFWRCRKAFSRYRRNWGKDFVNGWIVFPTDARAKKKTSGVDFVSFTKTSHHLCCSRTDLSNSIIRFSWIQSFSPFLWVICNNLRCFFLWQGQSSGWLLSRA